MGNPESQSGTRRPRARRGRRQDRFRPNPKAKLRDQVREVFTPAPAGDCDSE